MSAGVRSCLLVSSLLFSIGIFGFFLNRRHIIHLLISIELILLAVNINFVAFSANIADLTGQVFCVFILTMAAAEAAIGLAILVIYFRKRGTIDIDQATHLRD